MDWVQGYLERVKGGPGSGNFGHAGRPGQVGGSGQANATIMREGHRAVPGKPVGNHAKDLMSPYMALSSMRKLLRQTQDIPDRHLETVKVITTNTPRGSSYGVGEDVFREAHTKREAVGLCYSDGTVSVHPNYTDTMVVVHEVGHAVSQKSHMITSVLDPAVRQLGAMHPDKMAGMGMRPYSATNSKEFLADAYCVWLRGSDAQWGKLNTYTKRFGYELELVFGERGK